MDGLESLERMRVVCLQELQADIVQLMVPGGGGSPRQDTTVGIALGCLIHPLKSRWWSFVPSLSSVHLQNHHMQLLMLDARLCAAPTLRPQLAHLSLGLGQPKSTVLELRAQFQGPGDQVHGWGSGLKWRQPQRSQQQARHGGACLKPQLL